ncbi:MAG: lytic murein transglycosylase B [Gammaproteobacteria bacterium]|nr:lytic murein transglycosylase B [Gammaproteobacteria bacterium]
MPLFRIAPFRFKLTFAGLCLLTLPVMATTPLDEQNVADRADVQQFIGEMVEKHDFDANKLTTLFGQVELRQKIVDAITRPAEGKPWHQYRPIFVTKTRINEGVTFWNENRETLERAEKEYGVPPEIIVAIIGVETRYGRHKGGYRVMDSLSTLAFEYPKRSKFFRSELEQYLLLAREESIEPLTIKGSYAGAMGKPQFISSSYRNYAIDFDGDGKRDLWNNTVDAIGSVANYFKRHKWQPGGPVVVPAVVGSNHIQVLVKKGYKPHSTIAELRKRGATAKSKLDLNAMGALLELKTLAGREHWIVLDNFYVITRYNHSPLYAMAVYQLGQAIISKRAGTKQSAAESTKTNPHKNINRTS